MYKAHKENEHIKETAIPTLVDPTDFKLLGRLEGDGVIDETPDSKKKKSNSEDTPKASKKKSSKNPLPLMS